MLVGFVVECHRDGADHKVIDHLVRKLRPDIDPRFRFCGSKGKLFQDCGKMVEALFEVDRCESVFVIWDLYPCDEQFQTGGSPSCVKERGYVLKTLRPRDATRTVLLCITHELEAWLLADGRALKDIIEKVEHPIKPIADERKAEEVLRPKFRLDGLFKQNGRRGYEDRVWALKIITKASLAVARRTIGEGSCNRAREGGRGDRSRVRAASAPGRGEGRGLRFECCWPGVTAGAAGHLVSQAASRGSGRGRTRPLRRELR